MSNETEYTANSFEIPRILLSKRRIRGLIGRFKRTRTTTCGWRTVTLKDPALQNPRRALKPFADSPDNNGPRLKRSTRELCRKKEPGDGEHRPGGFRNNLFSMRSSHRT